MHYRKRRQSGFTIVELLVVIVVIGILVAITVVSYSGISQKASLASLQSDLANAANKLKAYQVIYGSYPTLDANNCPIAPTVDSNYCLKFSPGSSIATAPFAGYIPNNTVTPQTFSLTLSSNGIKGTITESSKPSILTPAPLDPVADWIATPQGDHYGNYYDPVSKSWATVTRSTPKTIYDPTTQHIYDVPANYLAINPWSVYQPGGTGSAAVIEEARTNYLLNSDISNLYGFGNIWTSDSKSPLTTRGLAGTFRPTMGRWSWTPATASKAANLAAFSGAATFVEGDYAVASVFIESAVIPVGVSVVLRLAVLNSSGTIIAISSTNIPDGAHGRYSIASSALPVATDKIEWEILASNGSITGQEIRVDFTAAQVEKGAFATSYIPTTTTAATRNADAVTVPTNGWGVTAGTIAMALRKRSTSSGSGEYLLNIPGTIGSQNSTVIYYGGVNYPYINFSGADGTSVWSGGEALPPDAAHILTARWGDGLVCLKTNGVGGDTATDMMSNMSNTATIGAHFTGTSSFANNPISRLVVYDTALSNSQITSLNSLINGP